MIIWMVFNAETQRPFDAFPFILLNLVLSCLAAIQAPVIMMSQNRMSSKDRSDARHDYEVNLKAEMEIMELHAKLDELVADRWKELLAVQERQIAALERIEARIATRDSFVTARAMSPLTIATSPALRGPAAEHRRARLPARSRSRPTRAA